MSITVNTLTVQNTRPDKALEDIVTNDTRGGVLFGYQAGQARAGLQLTLVGYQAGLRNVGDLCTFLGAQCGYTNEIGSRCTYTGALCGYKSFNSSFNSFYGTEAGRENVNGSFNTYIGDRCSTFNNGAQNICIGALNNNSLAARNVNQVIAIGNHCITEGSENILVGTNSTIRNAVSNAIVIGHNTSTESQNSCVIGNNITNYGSNVFLVQTSIPSDQRYINYSNDIVNINDRIIIGKNTLKLGNGNINLVSDTSTLDVANDITAAAGCNLYLSAISNVFVTGSNASIVLKARDTIIGSASNDIILQTSLGALELASLNGTFNLYAGGGAGHIYAQSNLELIADADQEIYAGSNLVLEAVDNISATAGCNLYLGAQSNVYITASNGAVDVTGNTFGYTSTTQGGTIRLDNTLGYLNIDSNAATLYHVSNIAIKDSNDNGVFLSNGNLIFQGNTTLSNDLNIMGDIVIGGSNLIQLLNDIVASNNNKNTLTGSNLYLTAECNIFMAASNGIVSVQASEGLSVAVDRGDIELGTTNGNIYAYATAGSGTIYTRLDLELVSDSNLTLAASCNVGVSGDQVLISAASNLGASAGCNLYLGAENDVYVTASNGQVVIDAQDLVNVTASNFAIAAQDGSGSITTQQDFQIASGANTIIATGGNYNVSAQGSFDLLAKGGSGNIFVKEDLVAQAGGNTIIQATSNFAIAAQDGAGSITTQQDFQIASGANTLVTAASNLGALAGCNLYLGAENDVYVTASNGQVVIDAEDLVNVTASNFAIAAQDGSGSITTQQDFQVVSGTGQQYISGGDSLFTAASNLGALAGCNLYLGAENDVYVTASNGQVVIDAEDLVNVTASNFAIAAQDGSGSITTQQDFQVVSGTGQQYISGGDPVFTAASNLGVAAGSNLYLGAENDVYVTASNGQVVIDADDLVNVTASNFAIAAQDGSGSITTQQDLQIASGANTLITAASNLGASAGCNLYLGAENDLYVTASNGSLVSFVEKDWIAQVNNNILWDAGGSLQVSSDLQQEFISGSNMNFFSHCNMSFTTHNDWIVKSMSDITLDAADTINLRDQSGTGLSIAGGTVFACNLNVSSNFDFQGVTLSNYIIDIISRKEYGNILFGGGPSSRRCKAEEDTLVTFPDSVWIESNLHVGGEICAKEFFLDSLVINSFKYQSGDEWWFQYVERTPKSIDLVFESKRGTRFSFSDEFVTETLNFTGKHRCKLIEPPVQDKDTINDLYQEDLIGKIVVTTGTYHNLDDTNRNTIDEAIPVVAISSIQKDKRAFGVIGGFDADGCFRIGNLKFMQKIGRRAIIQSLGEGCIWVCNANGPLQNGDYITTSSVPGYGMKQDDDIQHSYTVAKITCDTDFVSSFSPIRHDKKSYRGAFVGCVYCC